MVASTMSPISILSMAIVPTQEIVYYHKLRKILESYSVYPNLIIRWSIRANLPKEYKRRA